MKYSFGLAPRNPRPVPRSGTHRESGYRNGSLNGVVWRIASPRLGASILITSAPSSAMYEAQDGPRMYCVHESTRQPFSASGLPNAFLKSKVSRQNSSNTCCAPRLAVLVWVAITFLPGSDDFCLLQPREVVAGQAAQS